MATDTSNIGPGSVPLDQINRRRNLARAVKPVPLTGPGASGLGIGGNIPIRYTPRHTWGQTNNTNSSPVFKPQSYEDQIFSNVDTMLFRDRLAPARAYYETKAKAFKFSPTDMTSMIRAGIMSYGKGGNMRYRQLASSANLPALNSFLRDNYVQQGNNWKRKSPNLSISDNTLSYLSQGAIGGDRNQAISDIKSGRVLRNPRTPGVEFDRITKGTGKNKTVDYKGMAESYIKDKERAALWQSKIVGKIQKEGGTALWNKIMSGNYTAQDVQNLRQYMYSPNGEYGNAQEQFIQETLLNNQGPSPLSLIYERDAANIKDLMAENDKAQAKSMDDYNAQVRQIIDTHFDPKKATPEMQFASLVSLIQNAQGAYVPNWVVDQVMRNSGAGSYVSDSSVTGGKRFVPAALRDLTDAQKQTLLATIVNANNDGYAVPAQLRQYIKPIYDSMSDSAKQQFQPDKGGFNLWDTLWNLSGYNDTSNVTGIKTDSGLPKALTDVNAAVDLSVAAQTAAAGMSYLEPTKNPSGTQWLGNFVKGAGRAGLGFMPGMYYLATDPATTTKSLAADYYNSYGNWDGFKSKFAEDPFGMLMDVFTVADGIGLATKGAQIASAASRLGKVGEAARVVDTILPGQEWKVFDPQFNPNIGKDMPVGGEYPETGVGITRTEYAALMRKIANGDMSAKLILENLLPGGTNASNSLLMPTFMDKAAAFFEPRWKIVTRSDGNKVLVDQARQEVLQDQTAEAAFRFSGSPFARGLQRVVFSAQTRGGKLSPRIANIPLLGFNYRFDKAAPVSHLSINEGIRRELAMTNLYHKAIDDMNLSDVEQQVIMNEVAGGAYSPAVYADIIRRRLTEDAAGMNVETKQFLEAELKRMEDPARWDAYNKAKAEMINESSPRGIELARAHRTMLMLLEKQDRLISAFDAPSTTDAAQRAYAPLTRAAKLDPVDIAQELGDNAANLAMFNPNWHFAEQMKVYSERFVFEDGRFRPITKADTEHMAMLDQMQKDMEYIRQDHSFRNTAGHPFFVVDQIIRDANGDPLLVRGRRLRFDGTFGIDQSIERMPLIDERPLLIPASTIVPVEGVAKGVMTMPKAEAFSQLSIGAVNALHKYYPDVRDFTDKISDRSINTAETFKQRENRGIVVASGINEYHLKVQFKAHETYLRRRVQDGWEKFFDTSSYPVRVGEFDPKTMVATKTVKFFDNRADAEAYAANPSSNGTIEPGTVSEVTVGGKTMYRTNMRYFDVMKSTVQEQRTHQLDSTVDFEKAYLQDIGDIKNLDPNEIIMVVPRPTWNRFRASQVAVDAHLKNSFAPGAKKAGNLFNSAFKWFTLAGNPRWVPQSVVGSSMMVGLATPELFPRVMAGLLQYGARRFMASRKGEGPTAFSNHVDDFEYMTRTSPHDFESIYQQDITDSFAKRFGDSKKAKYTLYGGYTAVFAFESNLRVSLMREAALSNPKFKALMNSKFAKERAAQGLPDLGLETLSPFQATFELLRDPKSPFHDPFFMDEITHTADGVLGNYRDFSSTEKAVRNYLIPFYAWQRHSALFTKRLFQERPLAANAVYNLGNYGFDRTLSSGGVPDWLYESVPMPDLLQKWFNLDPMANNRLMLGGINPFSTTTEALTTAASFFGGQGFTQSTRNIFDYTNPLINNIVTQATGIDPRTGIPVQDQQAGFFQRMASTFESFPAIAAVTSAFKSPDQLNALRGMDNPSDIFVDPTDPNSKLSIPKDKLVEKYPTFSAPGMFNLVSPVRAMSLNADALVAAYRKNMKQKGVSLPSATTDQTSLERQTASLMNWKRKANWIQQYWMPVFGNKDPELTQRVMAELSKEFPELSKSYPTELYNQVMGGG